MKDFLGHEIEIGDYVLYIYNTRYSAEFRVATVLNFTPSKVRIMPIDNSSEKGRLTVPSKVTRLTGQDLTYYLLTRGT